MRKQKFFILILFNLIICISCSKPYNKSDELASMEVGETEHKDAKRTGEQSENLMSNFIATAAALSINDDSIHKFIKTAELKFRVKDIPDATYSIENIALRNGGFIIKSSIVNRNSYSTTVNISEDSALVTHYGTLVADIKLKIPRIRLDTVLKEIAPLALMIDYRTLYAKDVTLELLSDKLKQKRLSKKENRIKNAIDDKGRKLDDVVDAENLVDKTLEETDQAVLSAYALNEQIEYSSVDILVYQDQVKYSEKISREESVQEYEQGLLSKAGDALYSGWIGLSNVIIIILNIWPLILIGILAAILFNRYKRNKNM